MVPISIVEYMPKELSSYRNLSMADSKLHIAMYPWLAMGHLTPFLHLANKLANKGHRISFIVPVKTLAKLRQFILYPDLITFVPIVIPHVGGLPPGAETTADVPGDLSPLIATAMDQTQTTILNLLKELNPQIVLHDSTHWLPKMARSLGMKTVLYCIITPITIGYTESPARHVSSHKMTDADYMVPPPGFPEPSIKLHLHEARELAAIRSMVFGSNITFSDRLFYSIRDSDALAFKSCREIDGPYTEYLSSQFGKPFLLSGPALPEPPTSTLDDRWVQWLGLFKADSVIYCAFGTECVMGQDQYQELLLGLELTGMPFLAVLKPPPGADAFLKEFEEKVRGRGIVHDGWVQQRLILHHPSIGCYILHCGTNALLEGLVSKCRLVLLPHKGDQILNARALSNYLNVGVEVEKGEENGLFTRQSVCTAVRTVMDENNDKGREIRANHSKIREVLLDKNLEPSYMDSFDKELRRLLL